MTRTQYENLVLVLITTGLSSLILPGHAAQLKALSVDDLDGELELMKAFM